MAEQRLRVERREILGKKVGRLRRQGILPGVIFGHGDSVPVQMDAHAFALGYRRWGGTQLITIEGVDGDIPALVHGVSRDPRTGRLVHADFQRVSLTEKVEAEVPLHFIGASAAVNELSGVLLRPLDSVRVEAFPQDIPQRIDVDLAPLANIDDEFHVRDLVVDAGKVRILSDPDELVMKVVPQRAEEEIAPPPAAEVPEGVPVEEGVETKEGAPAATPPAGAAPASGQQQKQPPAQQQPPQKK